MNKEIQSNCSPFVHFLCFIAAFVMLLGCMVLAIYLSPVFLILPIAYSGRGIYDMIKRKKKMKYKTKMKYKEILRSFGLLLLMGFMFMFPFICIALAAEVSRWFLLLPVIVLAYGLYELFKPTNEELEYLEQSQYKESNDFCNDLLMKEEQEFLEFAHKEKQNEQRT